MLSVTRLRLFIKGYRHVIKGVPLDITGCTPAERGAYEEGKQAARDDMQERMRGPFNEGPQFVATRRER